jgi:hypothetical protein
MLFFHRLKFIAAPGGQGFAVKVSSRVPNAGRGAPRRFLPPPVGKFDLKRAVAAGAYD